MIIIFLVWVVVFGFPTWMTKSLKVAVITLGICLVISTIMYAHDDHTDPVLKDSWGNTAPLTLSYHVASTEPGVSYVYFAITNPTNLQYQGVNISCSYDFVGDDDNWHHHDSDYISQGSYSVEPNSTYTSARFDETDRDIIITHERIKNLSCSIMNGFLTSPSSYTIP